MNKQVQKNWDTLTGAVSILFGIIFAYTTYTTPKANFGNPNDPLYFPYSIAVLFIFLGAILIIKSNMQSTILALKDILSESKIKKLDRRRVLYTCIISVVYALVFEPLGYVISTFLFMLSILSLTNGIKKYKINAIVAFCFALGIYILFAKLLSISLPPLPFDIGDQTW